MQKHALTLALALAGGTLAFGTHAGTHADLTGPQGLYSVNDLLNADVYLAGAPDEEVGNVDNILLDDDARVAAVVVETGAVLGLGGRTVVVAADRFHLETERDDDGIFGQTDVAHRIMVDATDEDLEGFPEYEEEWWGGARAERREGWEATRPGEPTGWQTTGTPGGGVMDEERIDD